MKLTKFPVLTWPLLGVLGYFFSERTTKDKLVFYLAQLLYGYLFVSFIFYKVALLVLPYFLEQACTILFEVNILGSILCLLYLASTEMLSVSIFKLEGFLDIGAASGFFSRFKTFFLAKSK